MFHTGEYSESATYCILLVNCFFLIKFVSIGVVMYGLVHDLETTFGLCSMFEHVATIMFEI